MADGKANLTDAASAETLLRLVQSVPGTPWPWLSVWLLITAALWWLERSKLGA